MHQYQKYELSAKKCKQIVIKSLTRIKHLIGVLNNPEEEIKNLSDSLIKLSHDKLIWVELLFNSKRIKWFDSLL